MLVRYRYLFLFLVALCPATSEAALFFNLASIVARPLRAPHWLETSNFLVGAHGASCTARLIALQEGAPLARPLSYFKADAMIGMALQFQGSSIYNVSPFEHNFVLTPRVLAEKGNLLFEHYSSRRAVTHLHITEDESGTTTNWSKLFGKAGLKAGFSQIRRLEVPANAVRALSRAKFFSNVETLVVEPVAVKDLLEVLGSEGFAKVTHLVLDASQISAKELVGLLNHPNFAKITELSLSMMNIGDEGLKAVANCAGLARLKGLALEIMPHQVCPNCVTAQGFKALLESPHLALEGLAIRSIWRMGQEAFGVLETWPGLANLHFLELWDAQSEQDVARLVRTRKLPKLRDLRLGGTAYNDALLDALAQNTSLTSLSTGIVILEDGVSRDAVLTVVNAPHLQQLLVGYDIK